MRSSKPAKRIADGKTAENGRTELGATALFFESIADFLGVKLPVLVAGIMGGALSAILSAESYPRRITKAVVGITASVYATPFTTAAFLKLTNIAPSPELFNGSAFMTGFFFMSVTAAVMNWVRRWGHYGPLTPWGKAGPLERADNAADKQTLADRKERDSSF